VKFENHFTGVNPVKRKKEFCLKVMILFPLSGMPSGISLCDPDPIRDSTGVGRGKCPC